jgi:hypothetical protein
MPTAAKLTAEDFAVLDLAGRRFRSREGRVHRRGAVLHTALQNDILTVSVGDVEQRDADAWRPAEPFTYQSRRDITSIFRHADGRLSLDIMHIGSLDILPG